MRKQLHSHIQSRSPRPFPARRASRPEGRLRARFQPIGFIGLQAGGEAREGLNAEPQNLKLTAVLFPNNFWKVGSSGQDDKTPDVSQGSLLYALTYSLPDAWQIGMNPTITYNDKADANNQWNVSDHRFVRLDAALAKPPVYVNVIIFGFLVTMACFGAYRPQGPLVVLVSLYTVFVGLVLFLIVKLCDPFQGEIGVAPTAFEYLVETLQSEIR